MSPNAALAGEFEREAREILAWWAGHVPDTDLGGFHGEIDAMNQPVRGAPKGLVLNARILWFMSAAGEALGEARARDLAERAIEYIEAHFVDPVHGGVYWALDAAGQPVVRKKQVYAQAIAIYALCAHHRLTGALDSLALARELFTLIETRARDGAHGGYVEALAEDWRPIADMRLSEADANAPKSMSTHLHVLEAYAALYAVAPAPPTRAALRECIELFLRHIVDRGQARLRLYFDMDWTALTKGVSFGHDIEASWLIWQACEALGDVGLSERARPLVLSMARASMEGAMWSDGGLINERAASGHADTARVWWVQAEALVGYLNAFELSGDAAFLAALERVWAFIDAQHKDRALGEWTWASALDTPLAARAYKAGFWKGPYHNGRAMLECRARLARLGA